MATLRHEDERVEDRPTTDDTHEHTYAPGPVDRPMERRVEVSQATPMPMMSAGRGLLRMALTLIGAAGIVVGAFLQWVGTTDGIDLPFRAYWRTNFSVTTTFVTSAGFAAVVVGLAAVVGLATVSGWLIRLAGAVGLAAFVLMVISMVRSDAVTVPQDVGTGLWLLLAGAIVTLVAGFVPATHLVDRQTVTTTTA